MPTVDEITNAVQTGVNVYGTLSGQQPVGSGGRVDALGRRWCNGRAEDWQIQTVLMLATDSELLPITQGWPGSGRPGAATTPLRQANATEVGYWLWGHADCQHSGPTGNAQKDRMIALVSKYAATALTNGGSGTQTPGSYYPPAAPQPNLPSGGQQPVQNSNATKPPSYVDMIFGGIKNFFRGILGGAAAGAAGAAQAGGTASQASGSGVFTLIIFAVLLWLLIRD